MKTMQHPQEIEIWYVIPAIRREIVIQLKKQGLKQKKIATLLRITEPAISQYMKDKRAKKIKGTEGTEFNNLIKKLIKKAAMRISTQKTCAIKEIQQICKKIRKQGMLCKIHRQKNKSIGIGCRVCCD